LIKHLTTVAALYKKSRFAIYDSATACFAGS